MGLGVTSRVRSGIAVAVFGLALGLSVFTTGIALVVPLSLIVSCIVAWDYGLAASLAWIAVVHLVLPTVLALTGLGPFHMFPEARGLVALVMASSTTAELALVVLTVRLRAVTEALFRSKSALVQANDDLQIALEEVRELRGFLPICAWCKDIRDQSGNWERIELYVARHSRALFTHAICPKCLKDRLGPVN
jgi:hypothetical protein